MAARNIVIAIVLIGSLIGLQACGPVAPTTPPPIPTATAEATATPDSTGNAQIDAVLPQLIEQEAAWLSTVYTAKTIYITFGTLPLIEDANRNSANTKALRTQWTNTLNRHVRGLGEDYRPIFMLVEHNGQVETISFYEADATANEAPQLYFWRRQPIEDTQFVPLGSEENLRVTVGHTPAGRSVWITEAGTVLQYIAIDGSSILFPLSDDPIFLAALEDGAPESAIDLADIDRLPQELISPKLNVAGIGTVTPTRFGAELGLPSGEAFAIVIGDNGQETPVFVDANGTVLAGWNLTTLTWDKITQAMIRNILESLAYPILEEQYGYGLDKQGHLNVWHADGEKSIAAQVEGVWTFTETLAERDAYEIATIVAQLGLPTDQTYNWGDEAHLTIIAEAGVPIAEKGPDGKWVYLGEPVVMGSLEIEFGGRLVPFSIETVTGEADARPLWREMLGVESLGTNLNLANADIKLGELMLLLCYSASDAGVFDEDTGFKVSLEEYKNNPDAYPVNRLPGAGEFSPNAVTQIRNIYLAWSADDFRLRLQPYGSRGSYTFKNGVLTIYSTRDIDYDESLRKFMMGGYGNYALYKGRGFEQAAGERMMVLPGQIIISSGFSLERSSALFDLIDYDSLRQFSSLASAFEYYRINGFWAVTFTPDE